jgi:hypothetical protein
MATICFIQRETDYGPFFSTRDKAEQYLKDQVPEDADDEEKKELAEQLAGKSCYVNIVEVELDNTDTRSMFDG